MITEGEYLDANTSFERHLKQDDILAEFVVRWSESRCNGVPLAGGSIYRRNHGRIYRAAQRGEID